MSVNCCCEQIQHFSPLNNFIIWYFNNCLVNSKTIYTMNYITIRNCNRTIYHVLRNIVKFIIQFLEVLILLYKEYWQALWTARAAQPVYTVMIFRQWITVHVMTSITWEQLLISFIAIINYYQNKWVVKSYGFLIYNIFISYIKI